MPATRSHSTSNPSHLHAVGDSVRQRGDDISSSAPSVAMPEGSLGSLGSGTAAHLNTHLQGLHQQTQTMGAHVAQTGDTLHANASAIEANEQHLADGFGTLGSTGPLAQGVSKGTRPASTSAAGPTEQDITDTHGPSHRPPTDDAPIGGSSSSTHQQEDPEEGDLGGGHSAPTHPALANPLNPNPPLPGVVFHGSSAGPDVIFNQGLHSSAGQNGVAPHYNIPNHVHNANGSGFVSTTGNYNVSMQFVRPSTRPTVSVNGTTYQHHEGWIYSVTPSNNMIHVPSQTLPSNVNRFMYQDEWAGLDHIPPSQIQGVTQVSGYYNPVSTEGGGIRIQPTGNPNHGIQTTYMPNPDARP